MADHQAIPTSLEEEELQEFKLKTKVADERSASTNVVIDTSKVVSLQTRIYKCAASKRLKAILVISMYDFSISFTVSSKYNLECKNNGFVQKNLRNN